MSDDMSNANMHTLDGLALIELVRRLGGDRAVQLEYDALGHALTVPDLMGTAAYLASVVISIAGATSYPLDALIEHERADALTGHDSV